MPSFGVTPTGFAIRTLENLNDLVIAAVTSAIGVVPVDSLLSVLQIINERFAELWQLGQAVYTAGDVDAATNAQQDNVNAIIGVIRNAAQFSTVPLTWTGNPGVAVPVQMRAKTNVSLQVFTTDTNTGTLVAALPWVINTAYLVNDRVTNSGRCYVCTIAGTSAAAGPGPGTTASAIPDGVGALVWRYIGDGTATVDIASHALVTGPITALSGSITLIDTGISGVLGVQNLTDATVGSDVESNADYRVRREQELAEPGSGTAIAIRAALNPTVVPGSSNVTVFQNTTDSVNSDGMLPHSVEVLITGGDSNVIAAIILANVDGGIQTVGNTTVFITDDQGFIQTVKFSRPVLKNIYNTITVNIDASKFPSDGVTQIKTAISALNATRLCGDDVESTFVGSQAFQVQGVRGFSSSLQSIFPVTVPVASTTLVIASRELAVFDSSRIVINTTPVTP